MEKLNIRESTETWALLLTVHAELVTRMEAKLKRARLPPLTWYDVLWALERGPKRRLRMHELAHLVVLSRSNLTRLVDRLTKAGLVTREPSMDDKRGAYCVLTAAGLALSKKMWPTYQKCIFELFNRHLSKKEDAIMSTVLARVLTEVRSGNHANP